MGEKEFNDGCDNCRSTIRKVREKEKKLYDENEMMPKTKFGQYMVYYLIPRYENNVLAFVYWGAAFLVLVVGLRGLGTGILPSFLIDPITQRLDLVYIIIGLIVEFIMITFLGLFMFFKPEEKFNDDFVSYEKSRTYDSRGSLLAVRDIIIKELNHPLIENREVLNSFKDYLDYQINKLNNQQSNPDHTI